jgi:hypothetical protein
MKYVYAIVGFVLVLLGTHLYVYSKGCEAGRNQVKSELHQTTQKQLVALRQANQKILDLQRIIGNNNDECFNRLWPDEIIKSVNIVR